MRRRRFQRDQSCNLLLAYRLCGIVLFCCATEHARASCAEDITRIQLALQRASPEMQSRLSALVTQAETKARARDVAGCEGATSQALQALQLPVLPPLRLSTPMAGPNERARANQPSDPATSTTGASADPRSGARAQVGAANPNPAPTTPTAGPAGGPARTAGQETAPDAQGATSGVSGAGSAPPAQSGTSQAQPTAPGPEPQPPQAQSAAQQSGVPQAASQPQAQLGSGGQQDDPAFISTRDLLGVEVRDRNNTGRTLGRVASVILERTSGQALYVMLEWGGFLGWDRNRIVVPYRLLNFAGQWDNPTLDVSAGKIENAPQIQDRHLDALLRDPDWRRAVDDYFALGHADSASMGAAPVTSAPSGPRQSAQSGSTSDPTGQAGAGQAASGPTGSSSRTGPTSEPKASSGEGATGPTAGSGNPGATATTSALATPQAPGGPDPKHGQTLAQHTCAACHTLNQGGATRVGPNLFGVVDRPVASVQGYNYSAALKGHQGTWSEGSLDAFLKSPRAYAPGTFMTFAGIASDRDRRDVIAYLESLKAGATK
jgi:cytochrome c